MAERAQNIPRPDLSEVKESKRWVYDGNNGYKRYAGNELSPMPIPGGPGAYVANGSEHDDIGDTTHLPERHIQMTERRFSKIKLLEEDDYESEGTEHQCRPIALGRQQRPDARSLRYPEAAGSPR